MAKKKAQEWVICGRYIGSATGWDQSDTLDIMLYDFVPVPEYDGPVGDILVRFENGTIETFNEEGKVTASVDLLETIRSCPIRRTSEL